MSTLATQTLKKNLSKPDEVRNLSKSKIEVFRIGEFNAMRVTFQPGWKWSKDIGPTVGRDRCDTRHVGYVLSGKCRIVLSDGTQYDLGPGDLMEIPAGHDGWVIGSEPFVALDFIGGETYGKASDD